jgi:hypothetical protein
MHKLHLPFFISYNFWAFSAVNGSVYFILFSKELSLNTWYKTRYQVKDTQDNGDTVVQFTRWIDYDDGNGYVMVFQGTHRSPKDYYLDKAKFMEKSMFWIRLNGSGEIAIKDLKIWDLDEPA